MHKTEIKIKPVAQSELAPEFKKFDKPFGLEQHVFNNMFVVPMHVFGLYYLFYLLPFGYVPKWTFAYWTLVSHIVGIGVTVGTHRLWTHRTFKAKLPLQILLMILQTAAFHYPIYKWAREHRLHHKYTDTNADPHNSSRGFWFSHILWMIQPAHPEYKEKSKTIDMSDLANDPVVKFQSKYYWELLLITYFILPMTICHLLFPEMSAFHIFCSSMGRSLLIVHGAAIVNSFAHKWGDRPYNKYISSVDSAWISFICIGEGWHNYHHTFPWDYKTAELGFKHNTSTVIIHFFAWIGWAYDLKTVSRKMLVDRINRTGDGSHPLHDHNLDNAAIETDRSRETSWKGACWGWGDKQLRKEDLDITETLFPGKSRL